MTWHDMTQCPGDQLVCGGHQWDGHVPGRQREQPAAVQWRAQRVDTGDTGHVTCWDTLHRSRNKWHVACSDVLHFNVWFQYGVVSFGASTGCGTGERIRVTRDTGHVTSSSSCTCNVQATRMATPGSPPTWTSSQTPLDCSTNNALDIFFQFVLLFLFILH